MPAPIAAAVPGFADCLPARRGNQRSKDAMTITLQSLARRALLIGIAGPLAACGIGGGDSAGAGIVYAHTYILGGSIQGLSGSGLVLANGNQTVAPAAGATAFTFPKALVGGSSYAVQVTASPSGLTCSVSHGSGTVGSANITSVVVTCSAQSATVGGTISGLTAAGLVLSDGSSTVAPAANASTFTFAQRIALGASYTVTVQAQPSGLFCTVASANGTAGPGSAASVAVTCRVEGTEIVLYPFANGPGDGGVPNAGLLQASDGNFYGTTTYGGTNSYGTVFKITPSGVETVLYSFTGTGGDGAYPYGALIQASDGNFYGTTLTGGQYGPGTVFKITPGGTEAVVYSFGVTGTDGGNPSGGVIQGRDGYLYGTTGGGGTSGSGTVFRVSLDGSTYSVVWPFVGGNTDGASPVGSLLQTSDGTLYGTTQGGGVNGLGAVFKIATPATTPAESVLYFFNTGSDGNTPKEGLILGRDGLLYGTTRYGGTGGVGTIFSISTTGTYASLYSFGAAQDGTVPAGNLFLASDGNFYGATYTGGTSNNGTVFKFTPGGAETVIYSFANGTDAANPICGVIQGSDGFLYGTTQNGGVGNGAIFRVVP
jgi:uncharacterized repeat protein (TIGR03803 family)